MSLIACVVTELNSIVAGRHAFALDVATIAYTTIPRPSLHTKLWSSECAIREFNVRMDLECSVAVLWGLHLVAYRQAIAMPWIDAFEPQLFVYCTRDYTPLD
jgi:hypothetical protein